MQLSRLIRFPDTQELWRDPERRRALLLSVMLHLAFLLLFLLFYKLPEIVEQPGYFVIDVGPPAPGMGTAQAAIEELAAPAAEAGATQGAAPELAEDVASPAQAAAAAAQAEPQNEPLPPMQEAQVVQPTPRPPAEPTPPPPEVAQAPPPPPPPAPAPVPEPEPEPQVAETPPSPPPPAVAETPAEPEPVQEAAPEAPTQAAIAELPVSEVEFDVPPEVEIATEPEVAEVEEPVEEVVEELAEETPEEVVEEVVEELPEPAAEPVTEEVVEAPVEITPLEPEVEVAEVQEIIPLEPQVEVVQPVAIEPLEPVIEVAEVTPPQEVTPLEPVVEIAEVQPEPKVVEVEEAPEEVVEVEEPVEVLEPEVVEIEPEPARQPLIQVEVIEPEPTPEEPVVETPVEPEVEPVVEAEPLPEPITSTTEVLSEVAAETPAEAPQESETVVEEPIDNIEEIVLGQTTQVAPQAVAPVQQAEPQPGAASAAETPAPATGTAEQEGPRDESGTTAAETTSPQGTAEQATAAGVSTTPSAEAQAGGMPGNIPPDPYEQNRNRPIMAIIDNANPSFRNQTGLREASVIYEMPVEGFITRLMAIYDQADPSRIGPIRSARDYNHFVAEDMNGVLVHAGGSPGALDAIARGRAPSLDALQNDRLYQRAGNLNAPYNLFSGVNLRMIVRGMNLDSSRTVRGVVYRPPNDAPNANAVQVRYPNGYTSGFTYIPEVNVYRWQRNGTPAVDAGGEGIVVQAVLIARTSVQPIPGDSEGRLTVNMSGGEGILYLNGKVIEGRWQQRGGIQFTAANGQPIDLTPFKTWVMVVPMNATIN